MYVNCVTKVMTCSKSFAISAVWVREVPITKICQYLSIFKLLMKMHYTCNLSRFLVRNLQGKYTTSCNTLLNVLNMMYSCIVIVLVKYHILT